MKVQLFDSIAAFLEVTAERRSADPLRTNVIGSVAVAVRSGRSRYDDCRWWVVTDNDVVVAMAMRTSPFAMVLAPMSHDAARLLGEAVGRLDDDLPGLSGSREVVDDVLEGYRAAGSPGSKRATHVGRHDLMYELDTLTTPIVEGHGRLAHRHEVESLARMFTQFVDEVELSPLSLADAREGVVKAVNEGSLFCWEHDGAVVSFAGHAPVVHAGATLVGRVGPVYTPPDFRRHGYASAITALVSQHLVDQGARVMLFTDASNPTSNAIYQVLGYRLIDELVDVRFEER
jgi:predicted GNAT family acetyltransferase